MVSQPRRIAASSLMKRLRSQVGNKVGMRMGHGVRDDTDQTCIHFVTTGYLVRLVAHHPESFNDHTHLIIDEVHERSVDGDLLCLLARRLLTTHPRLRLILMSATVHTALYKAYFSNNPKEYYGEMDCLSVGVRRFPLNIRYLETLVNGQGKEKMPSNVVHSAKKIIESAGKCTGKASDDVPQVTRFPSFPSTSFHLLCPIFPLYPHLPYPSVIFPLHSSIPLSNPPPSPVPLLPLFFSPYYQMVPKEQYNLAVSLIKSVGQMGTAVLVFVSGIADITELTERFEGMSRYKLYAIHSDLPFEEQEQAFIPAAADEVKVVIATNAAESSITLPDCDCVICLGTHKALRYDARTHRVQLVNTWISKASATQRAGRTGRVRPGNVYRLYPQVMNERSINACMHSDNFLPFTHPSSLHASLSSLHTF